MLWRHLLQARKNSDPQQSAIPLGFALEARMMFDGAVAATVNQAENAQPAADATPAAASDGKDSAHAGDGTQTQTNQAQQDQSAQADSHGDSSGTHDVAVATEAPRKEVVFVDTSVADYQSLVDNVPAGVEVQLFDGSKDGLSQMVQWAQNHSGYDAIHVLSHGGEGEVQLGTLTLDSATATARAADLAALGAALTESGDLLLYGCDVAENSGQSFVSLLAQLTGADIAASTDLTGSSAHGGDWTLESHTGGIEAAALQIDGYQHLLDVSGTSVDLVLDGTTYSSSPVGSGVEVFMDLAGDVNNSNWYVDIDPTTSTITMTIRNGITVLNGITSFDFVFSGGTLNAITSITKDNGATTSVADLSATVNSNDKTITFHVNTDGTGGDGVLIWHFTSTNIGQSTAPTVVGTGDNPTFTENGAAVAVFSGVSADTHDSGQTFTGAQLTVSNVAGNTEYLTIHGVNVALSNGNSVSLGSGYGTATVSLSGGLATLTLSGATLSNADMSSLLSGITYGNSSDNPGSITRVVTLTQLTDSGSSDNTVTPNISSAVAVIPVNDAPTNITVSATSFGQSAGSNATVATLTATDADSTSFTYSLVSGTGSTDNARFALVGNTLQVNDAAGMSAGTYSVRVRVTDDGAATYEKVVTFTVVDDVAPTFDQAPAISNATSGGFTLSGSVAEAGTFYYVVVPDGASAPTAAQIIAGQNASGGFANASGYQILNGSPYDFSLALTGLAASTMYDVYVVAKDSAGNNTASVVKLDATTASAGNAPSLVATGGNPVFIGGMAGSVDLFNGITANTNDSGQAFSGLTLTVSNVTDSGEFINVGGVNISLSTNNSGVLTGIGNFSVTRSGNTVTLQLSGMSASNDQLAGLIDGLRYGNSNSSVTAGSRAVTLSSVSDSGSANNTAALNLTSSVNVMASNAALYVTSGGDTGADAIFGNSIQDDVNDGGGLSLREAIYWANQTPGVDRIVFQTNVTLANSIIQPTTSMLIDGQSFTLDGGNYSGFQIYTSSITFAIQNLTLTHFSTANNEYGGGVLGIAPNVSNANLRLYNVDFSNNVDDGWANGIIDMYNLGTGTFNFDFDRVNFHDNILYGLSSGDAVIRLFVSGTMQTVNLSMTNTAFINNNRNLNDPGMDYSSALYLIGNQADPVNTHISLSNVTIRGQATGITFEFNNILNWNLTARNSIIEGTNDSFILKNSNNVTAGTVNVNWIGTNNLIGTNIVDHVSATDPRLAATAANAINQGDRFYVTGDTDVRGLDRTRQGGVDIGAYESQFAAGTAPQIDLNGSNPGIDYSAGLSTNLSNGVAITDSLATLIQTDGDSRIWTLTLSLAGVQDSGSESLAISQSARLAAHAAGINILSDGQTLTLTGGATTEAFQTVLRAILYVNVAATPTGGTRTISVTVNDDATSTATSSLTLPLGNPPVVATPIPAQSVAQNGSLNVTVPAGTFTDPDNDALTLSATLADGSPLPAWLTFDPATNTFSGTPGNADVGILSIKVTATDVTNYTVSTTFDLTVTNVNDAPVVGTPVPVQSVAQDAALNFTVPAGTFSDPDGDTLTLSATLADGTALPSWLSFDPATGTFSGTPGNADVGSLVIKITASDPDNASVSTTFALTITNVNDAPVVAAPVPAQSIAQDGSLNFTVPAGTFSDPDGDTLTLSATLADGSPLPAWLTFNPTTNTFSGTPGNGDVGSISIKLIANDGDASVSTTFSLTITNVNDAPVVAVPIPAQGVLQDHVLNFTVPTGTFSDPDGDSLTLSATLADGSALPAWLTFNAVTNTFSGTPGNAEVGILSIKITATDPSNATTSTTFDLFVANVNDAPEVAAPVPAQRVAEGSTLNFVVPPGTFSDPDGDTLTLSATLADGSPLPAWLTFNPATNTFSGTPGSLDLGNLSIKITADDGDASVSTTFTLNVVLANELPVVSGSITPQNVAQDGGFSLAVPAGMFTDPDGDALTLSATLADGSPLPTWLTFDPATGTFSGTPGNADVGSLSIKVIATDPSNASASTTFALTVTNVNDAPIIGATIAPQNIAQDGSLNFTVPAGTFIDPDGDTLTLSATLADGSALPAWLSFDPATGTFSGTPGNGDVGSISIKVTANDGDASVSTTFSLTVTNVNDAPVVGTPIPPQSIAQDGILNFTVPAGTFVDPDGDALTLSATLADGSALPAWLTFNPTTGTFSGTPGNGDVGNISIKITANDGDASVSNTFSLAITNVNDVPVVSGSIPAQSVAQDGGFNFTVPAGTFVDPDGDALTLSATLANGNPLPAWLTFDPTTGTFSGTPGNGDVGSISIKVTANDGDASVSTTFSLTVTNVNDAPTLGTPIPPQSIDQGGSLNFTVPAGTFVDPDGDVLTLTATLANGDPLPTWLTFNPATGTFSGTPGNGDVGNISIKISANDGDASVSTTFSLTVADVNDVPVVSGSIPAQSVAQDGGFNFTVPAGTFVDPDGDALTLSATLANGTPLPAWLTFNPAIGTFSGTPGNGDVGNISIRVTASDGSASVSTTFSLTVTNVNDAPTLGTPIPQQSIAQGGSLNFTVPAGTFVDPDGDVLTLSATQADGSTLPAWLTFDPATGTFSGTPGNANIGSLTIRVTATDGDNTSISTTFGLTVTRAGLSGGDPQFRVSDSNGPQIPGSNNAPFSGAFGSNTPAADSLFAPATLGSFNAGRTAANTSVLASVFASSRDELAGDASASQTANVFARGSAFGNGVHFDSALGSFPSFTKDPAMGGASSLASVFSGIYLPSLNTMEVFSNGSWKGITLTNQPGASEAPGDVAATFIPSLHRQLQQIGEAEGQRLSAIEQALHESGQQQG